jgi:hypothetical protein
LVPAEHWTKVWHRLMSDIGRSNFGVTTFITSTDAGRAA